MDQSPEFVRIMDLGDPVNAIAGQLEQVSAASKRGEKIKYQTDLKYKISAVAGYYCKSDAYNGAKTRADALQAMLIAKEYLYCYGNADDVQTVEQYLDRSMPRTRHKIPQAMQNIPFIYPSKKHRYADQVRSLFSHNFNQDDRDTMFTDAKNYLKTSDQNRPLEVAMKRINAPINKRIERIRINGILLNNMQ